MQFIGLFATVIFFSGDWLVIALLQHWRYSWLGSGLGSPVCVRLFCNLRFALPTWLTLVTQLTLKEDRIQPINSRVCRFLDTKKPTHMETADLLHLSVYGGYPIDFGKKRSFIGDRRQLLDLDFFVRKMQSSVGFVTKRVKSVL